METAAILDFAGSEIWCYQKLQLADIYPHTKFGDISKSGQVMAI